MIIHVFFNYLAETIVFNNSNYRRITVIGFLLFIVTALFGSFKGKNIEVIQEIESQYNGQTFEILNHLNNMSN